MKALSMPISSPGRPEKFPPPLKRYSRTNAGSRSKSSPIFYRRFNAAGKLEAAQEPYSPKVTCIGQVRPGGGSRRRRCWFVKKAMLFSRLYGWRRAFRRIFCKWVMFFKADYCKKVDVAEKGCLSHGRKIEFFSGKCENLEIRVRENGSGGGGGGDPPPMNALSLTRCAPPLGERIWREKGEESDAVEYSRIKNQESTRNQLGDLEGNYLVLTTRSKSEQPARRRELVV